MVSTTKGIEAFLKVENEHRRDGKKISLEIHLSREQIENMRDKLIEGKLIWKMQNGRFNYSKKVYIGVGRSYASASPIFTMPFPFGLPVEKTLGYKVRVEYSSYILLLQHGELTGQTSKQAITTTIYVNPKK